MDKVFLFQNQTASIGEQEFFKLFDPLLQLFPFVRIFNQQPVCIPLHRKAVRVNVRPETNRIIRRCKWSMLNNSYVDCDKVSSVVYWKSFLSKRGFQL